jgi:molecular chaperone DnaJ
MASKNLYEILGLTQSASEDDIKKAFRKLAIENHPDKNPGDVKAEERFKEMSNAYQVLSDKSKKAQYDASLNRPQGGPNPMDPFHNVWADIFGPFGAKAREAARSSIPVDLPGVNVEENCSVSFSESVHGVIRDVQVADLVDCVPCTGTGASPGTKTVGCHACAGNGSQVDLFSGMNRKCQMCRGRKVVPTVPCSLCNGSGLSRSSKKVSVNIPPGIATGQTVRIAGAGTKGNPPGDLFIHIHVQEMDGAQREGLNIKCPTLVPLHVMINGGPVDISTPYGASHNILVPPNTQSGYNYILKGHGFPDLNTGNKGNLVLVLMPRIPRNISVKAQSLLEELAKELQ